MRRVLILGNGGSGKSWLAQRLGPLLSAPVHRLDAVAFDEAWRPTDIDRRRRIEGTWTAATTWIIEGNGPATLPDRLARADTVIVLDIGTARCLARILRRRIRRHGPARPHVPGAERLRARYLLYVARFRRRVLPGLLDLVGSADARLVVLRSHDAVERFLEDAR